MPRPGLQRGVFKFTKKRRDRDIVNMGVTVTSPKNMRDMSPIFFALCAKTQQSIQAAYAYRNDFKKSAKL